MPKKAKRRNPVAARLTQSRFKQRVILPRKGKGSYQRRSKHLKGQFGRRFSLERLVMQVG